MTKEYSVMTEGQQLTVIVSDETEALLAARADGKASVGLWNGGSQDLSMTRYLIESWEDLTQEYLEQVARRHLGRPWVIARTKRLVIREFQPEDAQSLPEEGESEADRIFWRRDSLTDYIRHQYGFYGYGLWAVVEKGSGKIAGKAGITNLSGEWECAGDSDALELGYHVFLPYRRRGYGLEACQGILQWYGEHMDCPLYANIDADNGASIRLIEKLGFAPADQRCGESGRQLLYRWNESISRK